MEKVNFEGEERSPATPMQPYEEMDVLGSGDAVEVPFGTEDPGNNQDGDQEMFGWTMEIY